jgi:hypothetical protein
MPFDTKMIQFYQDRLGTNLGKTLKRKRFVALQSPRRRSTWYENTHICQNDRFTQTGPGHNSQIEMRLSQAPTFLGLAGLAAPPYFDGKSLVPLLVSKPQDSKEPAATASSSSSNNNISSSSHVAAVAPAPLPASTVAHLEALGDAAAYRAAWRDVVFIE